jgi:hypothetical protein
MMSGLFVAPMMNTFFLELMPSISVNIWFITLSAAPPEIERERERRRRRGGGGGTYREQQVSSSTEHMTHCHMFY